MPVTVRAAIAAALLAAIALPAHAFDAAVARRITPEEVQHRRDAGEKPIIVDTRLLQSDATIAGAVHVPNARIESWAKDVPKDALIIAYCT
jgi:rhodanese-related sulfurtransferase